MNNSKLALDCMNRHQRVVFGRSIFGNTRLKHDAATLILLKSISAPIKIVGANSKKGK